MDRSMLAISFAAVVLLSATASRAAKVIDVTGAGASSHGLSGIGISYPANPGATPATPAVNDADVFAGVITLTDSADPNFYMPNATWQVFCTDIFTDLTTRNPYFVATSVLENGFGTALGTTTQAEIGWLINNYFQDGVETHGLAFSNDNEFAAATQMAVWQTEDGANLTFTTTDSNLLTGFGGGEVGLLVSRAASFGTSFAGNIDEWEPSLADGTKDPTLNQGQSLIGSNGLTNNVAPVPEPASLALLSAGMIGLAAVRRRKHG